MERREIPFDRIFIPEHFYEVGEKEPDFKVLFNRMSPSAHSRERGSGIFHSLAYLEHLELQGIRVINGSKAFRYEISKVAQHSLLKSLGLAYLPSRVVHSVHQVEAAAESRIRFGYWMPVFGGWLRNVEDEGMEASWEYVSKLARRSEQIGYDLLLIAELNLNDIKGVDAPSLDACSTSAALTAVTRTLAKGYANSRCAKRTVEAVWRH